MIFFGVAHYGRICEWFNFVHSQTSLSSQKTERVTRLQTGPRSPILGTEECTQLDKERNVETKHLKVTEPLRKDNVRASIRLSAPIKRTVCGRTMDEYENCVAADAIKCKCPGHIMAMLVIIVKYFAMKVDKCRRQGLSRADV